MLLAIVIPVSTLHFYVVLLCPIVLFVEQIKLMMMRMMMMMMMMSPTSLNVVKYSYDKNCMACFLEHACIGVYCRTGDTGSISAERRLMDLLPYRYNC